MEIIRHIAKRCAGMPLRQSAGMPLRQTARLAMVVTTLVISACQSTDDGTDVATLQPITFGSRLEGDVAQTRGGITGQVEGLEDLQKFGYGFGVYAYHTGASTWGEGFKPNFMYNQEVTWESVGAGEYEWQYTPLKYWPNDNTPADEQENNTGSNPATGASEHSYVSFFGYAPYYSSGNGAMADDGSGIVGQLPNTATGAPYVTYRLGKTTVGTTDYQDIGKQVDLLWAVPQFDRYKTMPSGEGSTTGRVLMDFKHALSSIEVWVQRVYDEITPGTPPLHPDNATDTKIFVGYMSLIPTNPIYYEGRLMLADGSWDTSYLSGERLAAQRGKHLVAFGNDELNDTLRGTLSSTLVDIQAYELDQWGKRWRQNSDGTTTLSANGSIDVGVTETPRRLHKDEQIFYFIPQNNVQLTPQLTYTFVTRDDDLQLGYIEDRGYDFIDDDTWGSSGHTHRYSRIVNTVTGNSINLGTLERGKRYILLCRIGVEHVSFELLSVEDWDFPIRFSPIVPDWKPVDYKHDGTDKETDADTEWQEKTLNEE